MTAQVVPAEDDDSFDEVPTVANQAKPKLEDASEKSPPAEPTPAIGIYRLVRPATSDTLATPVPGNPTKGTRVVIGVARR